MRAGAKFLLYLVLLAGACVLGYFTYTYHEKVIQAVPKSTDAVDPAAADTDAPSGRKPSPFNEDYRRMMLFGGAWLICVLGFGFLFARDISHFIANRAVRLLYADETIDVKSAEYERVQREWEAGNYLDAIQLLRDYHKGNPREVHSLVRIAEIYENDLKSDLAAALEYEEILRHKLKPERWGWTAIHLCNLYSRLNKPAKVVELLRRIESEYGQTAAGEKARKRLAVPNAPLAAEIEEDPPASCDV